MELFSAGRVLLLDAVDTALESLAAVPQDADVVRLTNDAQRLRRELEGWVNAAPDEHMAKLEKRVWALHAAVAEVLLG